MDFFFVVKSARPLRCMAHNLCTWICFQSQATPSFWLWVVWLGMRRPMRCLRSCWTLLFRTDMEDTSLQTNTRLTSTPVTSRYEVEGINHPKIILTIFTHPHVIPNTHTKKDVLKNVFVQNNIRPHLLSLILWYCLFQRLKLSANAGWWWPGLQLRAELSCQNRQEHPWILSAAPLQSWREKSRWEALCGRYITAAPHRFIWNMKRCAASQYAYYPS